MNLILSLKYVLFLSGFNQTSQFGDILSKNPKCGISWKSVRWKVAIFHANWPIFMKLVKSYMRVAVCLLRQETRLNTESNLGSWNALHFYWYSRCSGVTEAAVKCPRRYVCLSQNTLIRTQSQRTYRSDSTSPDDSSCSPVYTTNLTVPLATTVQ